MKKPIGLATSLSLAVAGSVIATVGPAAPQAQALTCLTAPYWTSPNYFNSTAFSVSGWSECSSVYAAGTKTYSDYVQALWWRPSTNSWIPGTSGYVWVTTVNG